MANKVTFLIGAGASAHALPIVKDIPSRLVEFRKLVHDNRTASDDILAGGIKQKDAEENFLNDCQEIINLLATKQHASIDTYAKRLRLTAPHTPSALRKYKGLKAILSSFFICEQLKSKVDYRYDSFLAAILGDSHTDYPEHVRILTWNYDFQFEKSFSIYSGKSTISENQQQLMVFEAGRIWMDSNHFGIYKLNGTTNFLKKVNGLYELKYVYDNFNPTSDKELVQKFIILYNNVIHDDHNVRSSLTFAWEEGWENETRLFLEKTQMAVSNTNTLVVIGYSFPFFNRAVDKRMIAALGRRLTKVYIQDIDADNVADNFASVLPDYFTNGTLQPPQVIKKLSVDQFFLPPEL